jgi:hypothetical protein
VTDASKRKDDGGRNLILNTTGCRRSTLAYEVKAAFPEMIRTRLATTNEQRR